MTNSNDRLIDAIEDMAVIEEYFSIVAGSFEDGANRAVPPTPSLHNELVADYIEKIVERALCGQYSLDLANKQ